MDTSSSASAPRMAERLAAARRGRFVGRQAEIALFRQALLAEEPPFAVLFLHGPGGVGKTTLLREFTRIASETGWQAAWVDGRNIEPSPQSLLQALPFVTGGEPSATVVPDRSVIVIDTCELLQPLDRWLRETFVPSLPARCVLVLAGRSQPDPSWRVDLDLSGLTRVRVLSNFDDVESETYLATRGVPESEHDSVLRFTHGHPLALALVVDARERGEHVEGMALHDDPDIVRALLERMVDALPDAEHRRALEVCVVARSTTEAMLASVLDLDDAHDLFVWLQELSFVEHGPFGVFPHDIAREVLVADALWRDRAGILAMSRRVYRYARAHVRIAVDRDVERQQFDAMYALRVNPFNSQYFDWDAIEGLSSRPLSDGDADMIQSSVALHEGAASASIVSHWLARQPDAFLVFRDKDSERFGFMALLDLHHATTQDAAIDPAIAAVLPFIERYGPLVPGEQAVYLRFWLHEHHYQEITAAINLVAVNIVNAWMHRPRLAWGFIAMADSEFWTPHFTEHNVPRAPEADFVVGGITYGVFAHDWRIEPPAMWLAEARVPMPFALNDMTASGLRFRALSQEDFLVAVRQALRDFTSLDRLSESELLDDHAFRPTLGPRPDATSFQALLRDAVVSLRANPRDLKFHRALWHTYIEPAPTQEQAAELLGLPFNTYRYHLSGGIARVADVLWSRSRGRGPST